MRGYDEDGKPGYNSRIAVERIDHLAGINDLAVVIGMGTTNMVPLVVPVKRFG